MDRLDFAIVTLVLRMKEIVIHIMSVKIILYVDQTIVQPHLALSLKLIAVMMLLLEMKTFVQLKILVDKMKEIVIQIMCVKLVLFVDQTIVQLHLVLIPKLIVVINLLLEVNIFVHMKFLVKQMKEIVILIMSAKMV